MREGGSAERGSWGREGVQGEGVQEGGGTGRRGYRGRSPPRGSLGTPRNYVKIHADNDNAAIYPISIYYTCSELLIVILDYQEVYRMCVRVCEQRI